MKFEFHKTYFTTFLLLFAIEVLIAVFLESGFIRHTFGDYLVVILLFCFFKSFLPVNDLVMGMAILCIAFCIEFLQLTPFLDVLGLRQNKWANLIFGNVFSVQDVIAYTLGVLTVTALEIRRRLLFINCK